MENEKSKVRKIEDRFIEQIEEAGGKWKCSHSSMNDGRRV